MKTTKDLFIPYDLAIELDKVDFKTAFFGFYNNNHEIDFEIGVRGAPMWQQVFDWFTDNHKISGAGILEETEDGVTPYRGVVYYMNGKRTQLTSCATLEEAKMEVVQFMIFVVCIRSKSIVNNFA
jgi:hypothetical protein